MAERANYTELLSAAPSQEGIVGAKMMHLSYLRGLDLPVPDGFTVTVDAFRDFITLPQIAAAISELAVQSSLNAAEHAAAHVRKCIADTKLPPAMASQIASAHEALCRTAGKAQVATAVRSSAIGEDSASNSFAGQYESYLGVVGLDNLCKHIKFVWASMFNNRAVRYRQENGIDARTTPMAVGVLELVDADCAGVAFSLDPVTGKRDRIMIEASWGLGEAVVGGEANPDLLYVDKQENRVMTYSIGRKSRQLSFEPNLRKSEWNDVPTSRIEAPCLNEAQAREITRITAHLEDITGHPVDVEWVKSKTDGVQERVLLVQYRPISAAKSPPPKPVWKRSLSLD